MGLALQSIEMPHLIPVMQDSGSSLTYLVDDLQACRYDSPALTESGADLEDWMNALQRQERPLIASTQGRANLEAWLELVNT
ncbi:MAG: hypothetical protein LCH56_10770 [Proteobacteria bacterium]|nr:hypothetical protein [Pseudomonadota bacterium]